MGKIEKQDVANLMRQLKNATNQRNLRVISGVIEMLDNYGIKTDADLEKYIEASDFNTLHDALSFVVLKDYENEKDFKNGEKIANDLVRLGAKIEQETRNRETFLHELVQKDEPLALEMLKVVIKIAQKDLLKDDFENFINAKDAHDQTALDYAEKCITRQNKTMDKNLCNAISRELQKAGAKTSIIQKPTILETSLNALANKIHVLGNTLVR
jgi:hypothetical protein